MASCSIVIQRERDGDGGEFACLVVVHQEEYGLPDSVRLDVRFDKAQDVASWVEEAVDAWL